MSTSAAPANSEGTSSSGKPIGPVAVNDGTENVT
jgi:hypothetical protein